LGPYGHDGASLILAAIVHRDGGEAQAAAAGYRGLREGEREAVIAFLNSLILYSTADLPTDLDGDGRIAAHFRVAGQDTGEERFNPEWLFNTPGQIEGPVTAPDGRRFLSRALVNWRQTYSVHLPLCRNRNGDGFPDALRD